MADIYIEVGQSIKGIYFYKILEFLGSGANAFAYRCLCTSGPNKGIEFALKLQYNLSSEVRRKRFFREASFLDECNHPAILKQYDVGTYNNKKNTFPFLVTNFMPETLKKRLNSEKLTFDIKIKYACQLLSAIAFLRSKGIVHRDIKPSNIFINNNNAILGDFGLIKKTQESDPALIADDVELVNDTVLNNLSGYIAMARYYRTPELVNYANRTDILRIESDIFQLGLVFAEMFTGNNPLRPSDDLRSPIILDSLSYVSTPYQGRLIRETIGSMLELDYQKRIDINLAIDRFSGIHT